MENMEIDTENIILNHKVCDYEQKWLKQTKKNSSKKDNGRKTDNIMVVMKRHLSKS